MKRKAFESEEALARLVVAWLESKGWDVYQEVPLGHNGNAADIVAVSGRLVWIIECKLSLGLSVLSQAENWRKRAHFRSVAVPKTRGQEFAHEVARHFGIGVMTVMTYSEMFGHVADAEILEPVPAAFFRKASADWTLAKLKPEHKTYAAAGTASGHRFTEYRSTCEAVRIAVERQPGITMKTLLETIKTHYRTPATARASLVQRIEQKIVPGVRIERDGKLIRLYPVRGEQ